MYWVKNSIKPEYIALVISVVVPIVVISVSVYISWRNRKYALAKEEYFKLKQVAEKIISKLLILQKDRMKLKAYFEGLHRASKNNVGLYDLNDTFNSADFEKNGEEVAALIEIYFKNLGKDWNFCLTQMNALLNLTFPLKIAFEKEKDIEWKKEAEKFNEICMKLGDKPKAISDKIIEELKKFKKDNLN